MEIVRNVNYKEIPVECLCLNEENAKYFNEKYQQLKNSDWNKIVFTNSGGISISKQNFNPPMWGIKKNDSCIELVIVAKEMKRIQMRYSGFDNGKFVISGNTAFRKFYSICKKYGIDLRDYEIDFGMELKKKTKNMRKYMVEVPCNVYCASDKNDNIRVFENVHHIDFHSSFMAGLANIKEEFRAPITEIYNKRKEDKIYKAVLTNTYGYFLSDIHKAKWALLGLYCVYDNNERVRRLAEKVEAAGGTVLLYNTDGFWYMGEEYHGEGEGKGLGEWENDHCAEKFRIKSKGAYEYVENGEVHSIRRGNCKLDKVKPRDSEGKGWDWGDIFETTELIWTWDDDIGYVSE